MALRLVRCSRRWFNGAAGGVVGAQRLAVRRRSAVQQQRCGLATAAAAVRQAAAAASATATGAAAEPTAPAVKQPLTVLRLPRLPIAQQLVIEEALLRGDTRNWCVLNQPQRTPHSAPLGFQPPTEAVTRASERAVVLGLSGDAHALLHVERARSDAVPLIRRFSGGGTVYVDHNTKFVTLIVNQPAVPHVPCFPKPVMQWTAKLYAAALGNRYVDTSAPTPDGQPVRVADDEFALWENDYCIGTRKFGGNAQCFTRQRWLHHTSFLWDYHMPLIQRYLTLPSRRPAYRADRAHSDFLVRLQTHPFFRTGAGAGAGAGGTGAADAAPDASARTLAADAVRAFAAATDAAAEASASGGGAAADPDAAVERYLAAAADGVYGGASYSERFESAFVQALRQWFDVYDPTAIEAVAVAGARNGGGAAADASPTAASPSVASSTAAVDWDAVESARSQFVRQQTAGPLATDHLKLTRVVTYDELDAIAHTRAATAAAAAAAAGAAS